VLKIGGGHAGALLGVSSMRSATGQPLIVVCLCEKELVLISGLL